MRIIHHSRYYRMLRNRNAAQESRDKKRQYVEGLEDENLKLRRQNADLAQRLIESEVIQLEV